MNEKEGAIPTKRKSSALEDAGSLAARRLKDLGAMIDAVYHRLFGPGPAPIPAFYQNEPYCKFVEPAWIQQLHSWAKSLVDIFEQGGGTRYIDKAIVLDREALALCPPGHPMRASSLTCLAVRLSARYRQLGATGDLEEAIVLSGEALDLCPQGNHDRANFLNNHAAHLSSRYARLGAMQDVDKAIIFGREALDLCLQGHPSRSASLNNLALHLFCRYKRLGRMQDLDETIVLAREALDTRPQGHPDRSGSLNNLALQLSTRYNQLGRMQDLDDAIVLARETLDLRLQGHPNRSGSLNNLALHLSTRYNQLGRMQDLDEAIVLSREALDLRLRGHPDRLGSLNDLGIHLSSRYKRLGRMQDLDEAIVLARETLDTCPQGHPDYAISLNNLAAHLSFRYRQLGEMQDLDEAIILDRGALDLLLQGHPDRLKSLNNLASDLSYRYNQLGAREDLDMAIVLARETLHLSPRGHTSRAASLSNLAEYLSLRYTQLRVGAMEDLDEVIALDREALDLRPQGHPDRSESLNNLASHLSHRYNQLGVTEDLNDAIVLTREALNLCPQGHTGRSMPLNNLALYLSSRCRRLRTQDLDEAILLVREAFHLCPQGHPDRSRLLLTLTRCLCNRFTGSKNLQDEEELFSLYSQLAHLPGMVVSVDVSAAREWTSVAEDFQHSTILLAYETSLRLLTEHLASLPSLPQHLTIIKDLASSLAVDAFSACLRKRAPARAVELLEQGRGVFWSQLTRLHSPLDDVTVSGPAGKTLAQEFARLALLIRNTLNSSGADQHEQLCHLNHEMQRVVANVRELPGLSRFLLPSLFSDLQSAASGGPVIIVNASQYSCDALIVFVDRDPVHISLQITQTDVRDLSKELKTLSVDATRADVTKELAFFLRKLWDQIVSPIVDFLQMSHLSQSRIWWCPTGEFSELPLHAAGPYRKGQKNLPDLYISSYTPTLTALIRARRRDLSDSTTKGKHFIAVGQTKASGQSELLSVGVELENIRQHVDDLATFTRIDGEESCISRVIEELGRNEWVHLACHGLPDPEQPFKSAFALHDGHFTVERITQCDLKNPEFAYLSACHTTVGDAESPDEAIHLASAMQFAGFRSVIGTMWAVDDGATAKVTSTFYKHMVDESGRLDHTRAAFALNETMKSVDIPLDQRVLYIHIGA